MTDPLADALRTVADALREMVRHELELAGVARPEPSVRLLSVTEAAALLGIGRTSLYDQMRTGRIRYVSIGSRRLIPSDAVAELIASSRQP